jgi:hypothetical protein
MEYYEYKRGGYSVIVGVDEHGFTTFHKILTPEQGYSKEVEEKFLEEAEAAAYKKHYGRKDAV